MRRTFAEMFGPMIPTLVLVGGLVAIAVGIGMIYVPAGVIAAGVLMVMFEYYLRMRG